MSVRLEEYKQHLESLKEQYNKAVSVGNIHKANDLRKGIKRVSKEIYTCEKFLGIKTEYRKVAL